MHYRNPRRNAQGTIDIELEHPTHGWIPFTASPDDAEEFGRLLFEEIKLSGVEIAPCPPKPLWLIEEEARGDRDSLLLELDKLVSNPLRWASFTPEQQQELAAYRQALLDVPQQEGFPHSILWPTRPDTLPSHDQ